MVELHNARGLIRRRPFYWMRPQNLLAARRQLRRDYSNVWRYSFSSKPVRTNAERSMPFTTLLGPDKTPDSFSFLVLADTGEGDLSQYALVPLIRALKPDFMIINGDIAYPAGRPKDFRRGFFEPYSGLGLPIWAAPGNHEYYSRNQGEIFHEIFCTDHRRHEWSDAGLRFEPQPGTYWELKQPQDGQQQTQPPLTVLAVDTGKKGDLDGRRNHPEDSEQHRWLEGRLQAAEKQKLSAIVLFHIPALVRQTHDDGTHLSRLHQIIAASPAVKLVLTGHIHNYQRYSATTFGDYLAKEHGATAAAPPPFIVCGAGGAYMSSTIFDKEDYPVGKDKGLFPTRKQYLEATGMSRFLRGRSLFGRIVSAFADRDEAGFLSMIQVKVEAGNTTIQPIFLESYQDLFAGMPDGTVVRVDHPNPPDVEANLAKIMEKDSWPQSFVL